MTDVGSCQVETAFDRQPVFVLDLLRDELSENQLFSEILGADNHSIFARRATAGEQDCAQQHETAKLARDWKIGLQLTVPWLSAWLQLFLQPAQAEIREQCQPRRGNGAGQNYGVIDHGKAAENIFPETAGADRRGNRCQTH